MLKTAMTLAAWNGRTKPLESDVMDAARLALPHRMRKLPFEEVDNEQFRITLDEK